MSSYLIGRTSSLGTSIQALKTFGSLVDPFFVLISIRYFGESIDPTLAATKISVNNKISGQDFSNAAEKTNTRSITPDWGFNDTSSVTSLIVGGLSRVMHVSLVFSRYYPVGFVTSIIAGNEINVTPASSAAMVVTDSKLFYPARKPSRRSVKCGYFPNLGNDCHLHKKTGGGAFEMTSRPHWHNDIVWTDPSVWKLGTGLEAINPNLFAPPAPPAAVATKSFGSILA